MRIRDGVMVLTLVTQFLILHSSLPVFKVVARAPRNDMVLVVSHRTNLGSSVCLRSLERKQKAVVVVWGWGDRLQEQQLAPHRKVRRGETVE